MGKKLNAHKLAVASGKLNLPKSIVMERRKFWKSQGYDLPPNPFRKQSKPKPSKSKPKPTAPPVRECLIVGKGPSAVNALKYLNGCPVVAINDSMKLFEGPVAYCFFSERRLCEAIRPCVDRVERFVCPDFGGIVSDAIPLDRLTQFKRIKIENVRHMRQLVKQRQVTHWGSATAAMSYLAYEGSKKLKLIGFDGGTGLAEGVARGEVVGFSYDGFLWGQRELTRILEEEMGVVVEWFS